MQIPYYVQSIQIVYALARSSKEYQLNLNS